jgi:hypothetical protein
MRITRTIFCLALLVGGILLAACSSGAGQHPTRAGTGQGGAPDAQTAAVVHCYRTHGDPGFPDPVYDPSDGRWHFAVSPASAPLSTQQACRRLLPSVNPSPPVPQAQFQRLVRLAQCIRQHGVPDWPDPNPDGAFLLPPSLQQKTPSSARALGACRRYEPSGGINVVAGS